MIYLDYSATTPINKEVLDTFNKTCTNYFANPNSIHKLGSMSNDLIKAATEQIASILKLNDEEIIYTSGASEANNLAIKGIAFKYQNRGKHIITTPLEHSSVVGTLNYLGNLGFEIDVLKIDKNGLIDLDDLKEKIRDDTILVTLALVDSEIGIKQNIDEISKIVKNYHKCYLHVDGTQAIGKIITDLSNIDLFSFSSHKIYAMKGCGCLIKKKNIVIEPLINGGKSVTQYRSGTPTTALITSMSKALKLVYQNIDEKYNHVYNLNKILREFLNKYSNVVINSTINSIPHILNFSIIGIKPETLIHALENKEIYISTRSACSKANTISAPVMALTNDQTIAASTLRISISYLTTEGEINKFMDVFDECYNDLMLKEKL